MKPGAVKQDPETGSVAVRTSQKGALAWVVVTAEGGVRWTSSAELDGWVEMRSVDHVGPLGV
jgi:hypothetical protein